MTAIRGLFRVCKNGEGLLRIGRWVIIGCGGMSMSCAWDFLGVRCVDSKRHRRSLREVIQLAVMRMLVTMVGCDPNAGIIYTWKDRIHTLDISQQLLHCRMIERQYFGWTKLTSKGSLYFVWYISSSLWIFYFVFLSNHYHQPKIRETCWHESRIF